jgi:hypothetical protein
MRDMASATVTTAPLHVVGKAECVGGKHPDPPLDDYPLLAWSGKKVHTEDGRATVEDLAVAVAHTPDFAALAARFGTTDEHVAQAVAYAVKAGFLGR